MEFDQFFDGGEESLMPPQVELAEGELFDPLAADEASPYDPADEVAVRQAALARADRAARAEAAAARPAEERIAELLERMHADRAAIMAILRLCAAPASEGEIAQAVEAATVGKRSVYSAATLCRLLEEAGALSVVDEDGKPFSEEELQPRRVEVDGVEYLEQPEEREPYRLATPAGLQAVEDDRPLARLAELFEAKASLLPVFKRVLALCSAEGGAKTSAINAAVDDDPLVQEPRFFASYFTEQLEKCDCLRWRDKAWHATETGLEALASLEAVEDDYLVSGSNSLEA